MKQVVGAFTFVLGLVLGLIGGAALLAYAYQAAGSSSSPASGAGSATTCNKPKA
jgi:hypothetical protein